MQESGSEKPIGYTVGENSSDRFTFVVSDISEVSKWEYVFASIGKRKVIGRIEKVVSRSDLLNQDMDFVSVKKYVETELADHVFLCQTKSLGSVEGDSLVLSRKIIPPGSPVCEVIGKRLIHSREIEN